MDGMGRSWGNKKCVHSFYHRNLKGKDLLEDVGRNGRIQLARDRVQWWAFHTHCYEISGLIKAGNLSAE